LARQQRERNAQEHRRRVKGIKPSDPAGNDFHHAEARNSSASLSSGEVSPQRPSRRLRRLETAPPQCFRADSAIGFFRRRDCGPSFFRSTSACARFSPSRWPADSGGADPPPATAEIKRGIRSLSTRWPACSAPSARRFISPAPLAFVLQTIGWIAGGVTRRRLSAPTAHAIRNRAREAGHVSCVLPPPVDWSSRVSGSGENWEPSHRLKLLCRIAGAPPRSFGARPGRKEVRAIAFFRLRVPNCCAGPF
jgi:hypothetical protein